MIRYLNCFIRLKKSDIVLKDDAKEEPNFDFILKNKSINKRFGLTEHHRKPKNSFLDINTTTMWGSLRVLKKKKKDGLVYRNIENSWVTSNKMKKRNIQYVLAVHYNYTAEIMHII